MIKFRTLYDIVSDSSPTPYDKWSDYHVEEVVKEACVELLQWLSVTKRGAETWTELNANLIDFDEALTRYNDYAGA